MQKYPIGTKFINRNNSRDIFYCSYRVTGYDRITDTYSIIEIGSSIIYSEQCLTNMDTAYNVILPRKKSKLPSWF